MKKFCLSLICFVVLLFVGFSTYYIVRNNETIAYTVSDRDVIYLNLGETISSPVIHENKASSTTIDVSMSNSNVVYDAVANTFFASKTGSTTIACVPSNANFSSITFTIKIGDGSINHPYFIRNEDDLHKIGQGDWSLSSNYQLVSDITLTKQFKSIGDDQSAFLGSLFGGESMFSISNLKIFSDSKSAGFFANLGSSAKVERIRFKDVSLIGNYDYAGLIAGKSSGFIGQVSVDGGEIINSSSKGYTGGIVGFNEGIGGNGQISLITFNGEIQANNFAGGLVGYNKGGIIDNCKMTADIKLLSSNSIFGGVVGKSEYNTFEYDGNNKYANARYINVITILNKVGGLGTYYTILGQSTVLDNNLSTYTYYDMILSCSSNIFQPLGSSGNDYKLESNASTSVNYYANLTPDQLIDKNSFTKPAGSSWDFVSNADEDKKPTWFVNRDTIIQINYENTDYPKLPASVNGEIEEITTVSAIRNALELLRKYPNANFAFRVVSHLNSKGEVVDIFNLNYGDMEITPIGSQEKPFIGKFIVDSDVSLYIQNYKISSDAYSSFFGVAQGRDTLIENITFSNGTYTGDKIGGIVGLNDGATINNCKIKGFTFDATGLAGGMAAINKGTISASENFNAGADSVINSDDLKININNITQSELVLANIAAENYGKISNLELNQFKISFLLEKGDKPTYLGGVVGKQYSGEIDDCRVYGMGINFAERMTGSSYTGQIVAYLDGGVVKNSFTTGGEIKLPTAFETTIGGIAGFIGSNGVVENCLSNGKFEARYAGGIAGVQYGIINKSAVSEQTIISGDKVGGLVYDCRGNIRNSYSLASLVGSSIEAGFATYLNDGASIRFCYNYCAYTGAGKGYCESATPFRSSKGNREFTNNIIVGENVGKEILIFEDIFIKNAIQRDGVKQVAIQTNSMGGKGSYMIVPSEVALGSGAFEEFVNRGFDSSIWEVFRPTLEEKTKNVVETFNRKYDEFNQKLTASLDEIENPDEITQQVLTALRNSKITSNSIIQEIQYYLTITNLPVVPGFYEFNIQISFEDLFNNELTAKENELKEEGASEEVILAELNKIRENHNKIKREVFNYLEPVTDNVFPSSGKVSCELEENLEAGIWTLKIEIPTNIILK